MAKLRGLLLVGLMGLLVVCAPPAQAMVAPTVVPLSAQAFQQAQAMLIQPMQAPPGPVLSPSETDKADTEKTKNKLIAGGVAIVLLLLVIWGRRMRSSKRKKDGDQAKGK
ncbi:hypothetical protein [Amycolatopsis sp. H20-H5]|uniref:hypothetical protein n=1 Tax=Amycolatopsis sp. H20-H5 TaxID=3046309 RepID=UPI002DB65D68|nr:hypothetical protein [Amycolatopsis sp. H20-H5]MEC3981585.1 hypothetical protein [Amycolatopsis sp. H20-H5]